MTLPSILGIGQEWNSKISQHSELDGRNSDVRAHTTGFMGEGAQPFHSVIGYPKEERIVGSGVKTTRYLGTSAPNLQLDR